MRAPWQYERKRWEGFNMKVVLLSVPLMLTLTAVSPVDHAETTNFLLPHCKPSLNERQPQSSPYLSGVCHGSVGTIMDMIRIANMDHDKVLVAGNCAAIPDSATLEQGVRVVVKYADNHPEQIHYPFIATVVIAFAEAWPCKD